MLYVYSAGSVSCDVPIWMSGSVGEGINSGSVLVVKTHNSLQHWAQQNCSNPKSVITVIYSNVYMYIVRFVFSLLPSLYIL